MTRHPPQSPGYQQVLKTTNDHNRRLRNTTLGAGSPGAPRDAAPCVAIFGGRWAGVAVGAWRQRLSATVKWRLACTDCHVVFSAGEPIDVPGVLIRWRVRPLALVVVGAGLVVVTAVVVISGGPPTPFTHLFYLAVIAAAMLWGPWAGVGVGVVSGTLAEPVARALLGSLDSLDNAWLVRALVMALVGWVCGSLARSLLGRMEELELLNRETILAFVRAIDARDPYTARHSETVAAYATALAQALRLAPAACERIALAGLLHDVGKVALERSILNKPGALTDEEWREMREHPARSAHIVGAVTRFAGYLPGARHHHEHFDGSGYPDGLAGEQIPLDARIIAVADAYDAMTSDRSYRPALSHDEAICRIEHGAGSQFDPACARAFVTLRLNPATIHEVLVPVLALDPVAIPA